MKTSISCFLTQRSHASHTSLGPPTSLIGNLRRCSAIDLCLLQCMPYSQKAWMPTKKKLKRALISQMQNLQRCFRERPHGAKHHQVKPKPRLSTNPAPDCLSFQNNILYFNGQPIGMGVFYDALPSEGSEVTISGSTNAV